VNPELIAPPRAGCVRRLFDLAITVVVSLTIFWLLSSFVVSAYRVEQQSMLPELRPDDYLLVDKISPHVWAYQRGDVVVLQAPPGVPEGFVLVKRVIGLPGDRVAFADGHVVINDHPLAEPWLPTGGAEPVVTAGPADEITVPIGSLYLMGDNRAVSFDSRNFGPVAESEIIGRVRWRYWPISEFGPVP
jgi:signal peptidase I